MLKKWGVWFSFLFVLVACPAQETEPSSSPSPRPVQSPKSEADLRGVVVIGDGLQSVKPCGKNQYYWLHDPNENIRVAYREHSRADYEPLYLEADGKIQPITEDMAALEDYTQAFVLGKIKTLKAWSPEQNCFQSAFMALGFLPDWQIWTLGDEVIFQDLSPTFPIAESLVYHPPKPKGKLAFAYTFQYRTPESEQLKLVLAEETCRLQGKTYTHRATIHFHGRVYLGCGFK